jgi:hypothetical protein
MDRLLSLFFRTKSLFYDAISFAFKFPVRIRYKIYRRSFLRSYQLNLNLYIAQVESFEFKSAIDDKGILPGRVLKNEELNALIEQEGIHEMVYNVFDHKLKILSNYFFDINHVENIHDTFSENYLKTYNKSSDLKYQRVNWHKDFRSGYKWNANSFYTNIKVAEQVDADIKVPRELSRFNHIGLLVLGERVLGKSGSNEFILQVMDWISQNKFGHGVNWACAMDVGLRAINWIWGVSLFRDELEHQHEFMKAIKHSLYFHAIHIEHNLEYSPITTGNHYLSNIVGLLYISAFLTEVDESDRWLIFCLQEILSEMKREVYEDGVAHEGSTHYHRLVTELFISASLIIERIPLERLRQLSNTRLPEGRMPAVRNQILKKLNLTGKGNKLPDDFYKKLFKMAAFTAAITKQNNCVPQFGDNDSARVHKIVFCSPENFSDHRHILATISKMLGTKFDDFEMNVESQIESDILTDGLKLTPINNLSTKKEEVNFFKNAGIVSVKKSNLNLIVTCGQNGQSKRGGHNHNDKLSFELNLYGHDVFVDSGCPVYTANPAMRNFFRGTAAHNTIIVGKREQDTWSEGVTGLFSLRQMSSPQLTINDNVIKGIHFGYSVPHYRKFVIGDKSLVIKDRIRSKQEKVFNLTLDPRVVITNFLQVEDEATCTLLLPGSEVVQIIVSPIETIEVSTVNFGYSYGVFGETKKISLKLKTFDLLTHISWANH